MILKGGRRRERKHAPGVGGTGVGGTGVGGTGVGGTKGVKEIRIMYRWKNGEDLR